LFGSLYPDDLREGLELLHRARGSDEPQRKEKEATAVRCVRGDGQMVWGSLEVQRGSRSGSGAGYLVLKAEDIDERKNAELSMRSLTPREMEVLKLQCEGRSNPKIAERLAISAHRQVTRAKHHREARRRGSQAGGRARRRTRRPPRRAVGPTPREEPRATRSSSLARAEGQHKQAACCAEGGHPSQRGRRVVEEHEGAYTSAGALAEVDGGGVQGEDYVLSLRG
jgi:hypothetical protein